MGAQRHHGDVDPEDPLLPVLYEDALLEIEWFGQTFQAAEIVLQFHTAVVPSAGVVRLVRRFRVMASAKPPPRRSGECWWEEDIRPVRRDWAERCCDAGVR